MYCRKCGRDIGDDRFCPSCGFDQTEGVVHGDGAPAQQSYHQQPVETDMSVGDWVIALLIALIPIVGLVVLIIWAVSSSDKKPSRKNWAMAQLIIMAIIVVVFFVIIFALAIFASSK